MRKASAILAAKLIRSLIKITKKSSGSALPGLVAQIIDPLIISKLAGMLPKGTVLITGTNGKTTTAKMTAGILEQSGMTVVYNFNGSNLERGLASTLIQHVNLTGTKIQGDIGVFEVDEAAMPKITAKLKPRLIIVTNLFRDQLDRYGEVDKTAAIIGSALKASSQTQIILNADDPLVANLNTYNSNAVYFGINTDYKAFSQRAIDSHHCLACQANLIYSPRYFSHLGNYYCPQCHKGRPVLHYKLHDIALTITGSSATFITPQASQPMTIALPGFYNLYNALAAASAADCLRTPVPIIKKTLADLKPAFGRMETIALPGKKSIVLMLVKNPASFNQSLEMLVYDQQPKNLLFILNDNLADGVDISWIWDVEFEPIRGCIRKAVVSGSRADDMALRLKYAEFPKSLVLKEHRIQEALDKSLSFLAGGETLYALVTYTAMLNLRRILAARGLVKGLME